MPQTIPVAMQVDEKLPDFLDELNALSKKYGLFLGFRKPTDIGDGCGFVAEITYYGGQTGYHVMIPTDYFSPGALRAMMKKGDSE